MSYAQILTNSIDIFWYRKPKLSTVRVLVSLAYIRGRFLSHLDINSDS